MFTWRSPDLANAIKDYLTAQKQHFSDAHLRKRLISWVSALKLRLKAGAINCIGQVENHRMSAKVKFVMRLSFLFTLRHLLQTANERNTTNLLATRGGPRSGRKNRINDYNITPTRMCAVAVSASCDVTIQLWF